MFGYVRIFKPELKVRVFQEYQAFYCGLCKESGRRFGKWSHLALTYDATFLSLLHNALSTEPEALSHMERCAVNPFLKKECASDEQALSFAADMSMLLLYYKVQDNLVDSSFTKRLASFSSLLFVSGARKKAARLYPEADEAMAVTMHNQQALEAAGCTDIDQICEPSASGLAGIMAALSAQNYGAQRENLKQFGYLLGRWIYLIDALDDFEKDKKSGDYNVFARRYPQAETLAEILPVALPSLNLTLGALFDQYKKLVFFKHQDILDNILYLGLPMVQKQVIDQTFTQSRNTETPTMVLKEETK